MQQAVKEHQRSRAIELAEHLLDQGFVDWDAHMDCFGIYTELGDTAKATFHLQAAIALVASIMRTGDGKTKETAFEVISDREEYYALTSLGLPYLGPDVSSQSEVMDGAHHYDRWSVRDPKRNEVVEVFFNTDQFSQTKSRVGNR